MLKKIKGIRRKVPFCESKNCNNQIINRQGNAKYCQEHADKLEYLIDKRWATITQIKTRREKLDLIIKQIEEIRG